MCYISFHILQIMPPSLSLIREKYLNSENKVFYHKYLKIVLVTMVQPSGTAYPETLERLTRLQI